MTSHRFSPETLLEYLTDNKFEFTLYEHPAVFTCEESDIHLSHIEAQGTKNLFLKEEKASRIFLVTVPDSKRVDLNKLRHELNAERLTFGKPELLWECLGVEPGSVTVFGIANDEQRKVELFIDPAVMDAPIIQAHPLRNTASLTFAPKELLRFLKEIEREIKVIEVPAKV
jgi:Ala-tRNA(Pro) deacylase